MDGGCRKDLPQGYVTEADYGRKGDQSGAEMPGDEVWSQLHGYLEGRSEGDSNANRADLPEPATQGVGTAQLDPSQAISPEPL